MAVSEHGYTSITLRGLVVARDPRMDCHPAPGGRPSDHDFARFCR